MDFVLRLVAGARIGWVTRLTLKKDAQQGAVQNVGGGGGGTLLGIADPVRRGPVR